MSSLSIGLSALRANQVAMDTAGQNLSNVSTPGFHRRMPLFESRGTAGPGKFPIGLGVGIADIHRLRSELLEEEITNQTSQGADTTAQLDTSRQIEAFFKPSSGSLDSLIESFYNQLQQVAAQPDDPTLRRVAIDSGVGLANTFNGLTGQLDGLRQGLDNQMSQTVSQINTYATQIAQLNGEIQRAEGRGFTDADARDQRDRLINQLAGLIDVRVIPDGSETTIISGGVPLVIGEDSAKLQYTTDVNNNGIIVSAGSTQPLKISSGQLAGLLQMRNQSLPDYRSRLDTLANQLKNIDGVQSTGLGLSGPFPFLASTRPVKSITAPLAQAGLALPPQPGQVWVSVTDPSGNRTLTAVNTDPNGMSLQDLANAFSAVPHLSGTVNTQSGLMQITAAPGYTFDFAGRLSTAPTSTNFTTGSPPTAQASGTYTGTSNDLYTYTFSGGPGTVGVTPGLKLTVTNSVGQTIASLDVGQGYSPGTDLTVANGVSVKLSSGDVNNGDTFTTQVIAQPDTSGVLVSLGLNTFFTGSGAGGIAVQPALTKDPQLLAASRSGAAGDGTNLQRMAATHDALTMSNGTQTVSQFYASMVGDIGSQVQDLNQRQTADQSLKQSLDAQQQSVSGVDPNEELLTLLQYQRGYQLASKYISVVNDTMNQLLQIIR
jgi:flagellar hook-associated protein FlgK